MDIQNNSEEERASPSAPEASTAEAPIAETPTAAAPTAEPSSSAEASNNTHPQDNGLLIQPPQPTNASNTVGPQGRNSVPTQLVQIIDATGSIDPQDPVLPTQLPQPTDTSTNFDPQDGHPFFRLPQELRDKIYADVFLATRLASGHRIIPKTAWPQAVVSTPNSLALLHTCKRIHNEIGQSWLGQVMWHFESLEALLDKLAVIPIAARSMIRNLCVSGAMMSIYTGPRLVPFRASHALKLLPGVKLDRLTVTVSANVAASHDTLAGLLRHSNGWKELYYLWQDSDMLTRGSRGADQDGRLCYRIRQHKRWQAIMHERDGSASGASVAIYRASRPDSRRDLMRPHWVELEQVLDPGPAHVTHREGGRVMSMAPFQDFMCEVLILVRRGEAVDYEEKAGSACVSDGGIQDLMPGRSWAQIKGPDLRPRGRFSAIRVCRKVYADS